MRPVVDVPNSLKAKGESPPAKEAQAASQVTPEGAAWKLAPRRSEAEAVREGSVEKSFFLLMDVERRKKKERKKESEFFFFFSVFQF